MLDRRNFLKAAAGLAFPAVIPARALGRAGAVAPSDRVVVACIGTGWQGGNNVKSFLDEPGAQVVALCDIDTEHLAREQANVNTRYGNRDCATYHFFEEVLARPDIDAVLLSLPDHWHGLAAVRAAEAGKDIYGEKPLGAQFCRRPCHVRSGVALPARLADRKLAALDRRFPLRLRTGAERPHRESQPGGGGPPRRAHRLRRIGPPGLARAPAKDPGLRPLARAGAGAPYCPARIHKTWRWNLDYGGGLLMDWIGHHVDIAHWGLGLDQTGPLEVTGKGEFSSENRIWNAPAKFRVEATYAGGVTMLISGGYTDIRSGVRWIGDRGWVWADRSGLNAEPNNLLTSKIGPNEIHLEKSPGHHRQFLECVRSRRRTLTPPEVALRSATPGYLGLISMLVGHKVRWDPQAQKIIGDSEAERLLSRSMRSPYRL